MRSPKIKRPRKNNFQNGTLLAHGRNKAGTGGVYNKVVLKKKTTNIPHHFPIGKPAHLVRHLYRILLNKPPDRLFLSGRGGSVFQKRSVLFLLKSFQKELFTKKETMHNLLRNV